MLSWMAVAAGLFQRLMWQGGYNEDRPERLAGDWSFTAKYAQVLKFILLVPLLSAMVAKNLRNCIESLLYPCWFYVWYYGFEMLRANKQDFNPSGHICCTVVALQILVR